MRRTTPVEPIERIEPAEPLQQIIKGRHAPRANPLNPSSHFTNMLE